MACLDTLKGMYIENCKLLQALAGKIKHDVKAKEESLMKIM